MNFIIRNRNTRMHFVISDINEKWNVYRSNSVEKMRCPTDTKSTIHKKEEYSKYTALANTYSNNNKPI